MRHVRGTLCVSVAHPPTTQGVYISSAIRRTALHAMFGHHCIFKLSVERSSHSPLQVFPIWNMRMVWRCARLARTMQRELTKTHGAVGFRVYLRSDVMRAQAGVRRNGW